MSFKIVILLTVLVLCTIGTASADEIWVSDSDVVNDLPVLGYRSRPEVFNDNGTLKLIASRREGDFYGYQWNGASWVSNSSIVNGVSTLPGDWPDGVPSVFNDSGTLKLITVSFTHGDAFGYQWNGTSWVSNSSIVNNLTVPWEMHQTIFNDSGTWRMIGGEWYNKFNGQTWNGTSWNVDNDVINGLTDGIAGTEAHPDVYNDSGILKLIVSNFAGTFYGFQWNGTSWVSNSSIVNGIGQIPYDFFPQAGYPAVFDDNGTTKLIAGSGFGDFYGYYLNTIPITSNLKTENQTNSTQITTNTSTPYFNWTYSDADNDTQYSWEIQVGTTEGGSDMWASGALVGNDLNDVYAGSALSRNVMYYVRVRTNDGDTNSLFATGTFKLNALPTVNNIVITPGAPLDTDDLVVSNDTAVDGNGDPTTAYYKWYKDDVHQPALNDVVTVNASNTTNDEVWKVGVIPNDTYENGTEVFSATVTIGSGNYAPTITGITTNVSSKKYNYTVLVSSVDAFDQNGDNYTLHVGSSSGANDLCNSSTTLNGTEASCVITIPWTSGAHVIYGRLTDYNDTSIEKNIVFNVDVTPPIYVTSGVSPISTGGSETVTITASITLANGSIDYVKARVLTPSATYTNYTMTGSNGSYSYSFVPAVAGSYIISSILASDDSGNTMEESVSHVFQVVSGGGGGGGAPVNITVVEVGDLTLTPDRRDTYFWYTALSGEQIGEWTFIANRNLETCRVEPNNYTTCEIVDGYIVKVRLTVDEDTPTYDGTLTVNDANNYTASSTIVIRVVNIWSAIPFPAMNVGPLSTVTTPFFETEGNFIIGLRTYVLGMIGVLFVFALFMSKRR